MNIELVDLKPADFQFVKQVYDYYIKNSTATFHTESVPVEELGQTILTGHPRYRSFLILKDGQPCGFCYISRYKPRQAYDRTAEVTIYLLPETTGKGIGTICLEMLETIARDSDISVLIGVITAENKTSVRLFEKCGYMKCAHYQRVGEKFNRVLDVVSYQKLLENNTNFTGTE